MNCKLGGRYKLEVLNSSGEVVRIAEVDNLILDGALSRWAAGNTGFNNGPYFCVGTGTDTPIATQTSLSNFLAGSLAGTRATRTIISPNENRGGGVYRAAATYVYTYSIGQIVGNISEIGANFGASSSSNLDSRALLVDGGGNPTTLTILSTEQLRVNYRVYMDISPAQSTATITFNGVSTSCTLEKLNTNLTNSWYIFFNMNNVSSLFNTTTFVSSTANLLNSVDTPSSTSGHTTATVSWAVSSGGAGIRRHVMTMAVGSGNIASGIKYLTIAADASSSYHMLGVHFSPNINKTSSKTLTLTIDLVLSRA